MPCCWSHQAMPVQGGRRLNRQIPMGSCSCRSRAMEQFTATSQRCWLTVHSVPVVTRRHFCLDCGATMRSELFYLCRLEITLLTTTTRSDRDITWPIKTWYKAVKLIPFSLGSLLFVLKVVYSESAYVQAQLLRVHNINRCLVSVLMSLVPTCVVLVQCRRLRHSRQVLPLLQRSTAPSAVASPTHTDTLSSWCQSRTRDGNDDDARVQSQKKPILFKKAQSTGF